eukprot:scaffold113830_cov22-Tisochrysis_lutea.AAC.1
MLQCLKRGDIHNRMQYKVPDDKVHGVNDRYPGTLSPPIASPGANGSRITSHSHRRPILRIEASHGLYWCGASSVLQQSHLARCHTSASPPRRGWHPRRVPWIVAAVGGAQYLLQIGTLQVCVYVCMRVCVWGVCLRALIVRLRRALALGSRSIDATGHGYEKTTKGRRRGSANKGEQGPARPQLPLAHCSLLSSTTTCSPAYSTMMLLHMRCQG